MRGLPLNSRRLILTGSTDELDWPRLLAAAPDTARFVGFVSEAPELDPENADDVEFVEDMRKLFLVRQAVTEWPSTRTFWGPHGRHLYEFNEKVVRLLAGYWARRGWGDGLNAGDLHILHEDGTLWFTSENCEGLWWVEVDPRDEEKSVMLSGLGVPDPRPVVETEYAKVWLDTAALGGSTSG